MIIQLHRRFERGYRKLPVRIQEKVRLVIGVFAENPQEPSLRNHALVGRLIGLRAFSVTNDIRIIFEERDGYAVVLMLDVGGHVKVYGE